MEVYSLDGFSLLILVHSSRNFWIEELSAICHFVRSPRRLLSELCDWLQQSLTSHSIGPVLFFPHAWPAGAPRPSNSTWRGFEHTGTIPQSPCRFAVAWHAAVAVAYVSGGPYDTNSAKVNQNFEIVSWRYILVRRGRMEHWCGR